MNSPQSKFAKDPNLTVIIVSYNTRDLTLAALRTLYESTHQTNIHTVVFDNDSRDKSADAVNKLFPQVELIRSRENVGFARANNLVARNAKTDWLLLLNPDTEVHDGAVDRLMDFACMNPQAGIYGGRTVFPDGSLNIASCWNQITLWSAFCAALGLSSIFKKSCLFNPEALGGWKRDSVREVDIVVGCFMLISRSLWNQLGGFDLRYFMYGEEADLCLRAAQLGYKPMVTPDAQIMHIVGAACKQQGQKKVMVAKARVTLIRDHWPKRLVFIGCFFMWGSVAIKRIVSGGAAMIMPTEKVKNWAESRKIVWQERHDWLKGY